MKAAVYLRQISSGGYPELALLDPSKFEPAAQFLEEIPGGFEAFMRHFNDRPRNARPIAMLVKLVQQSTGANHDAETSALVHAMTDQIPTPEDMKEWRKRNRVLIEQTPTPADKTNSL